MPKLEKKNLQYTITYGIVQYIVFILENNYTALIFHTHTYTYTVIKRPTSISVNV